MGNERIPFNGDFTDEIRAAIRSKRIELGLQFNRIASFMGVNWSTFRKWENGPTRHCDVCYRPKIENFINGNYDSQLLTYLTDTSYDEFLNGLPERIQMVMEKFTNAYALCNREQPEIGEEMLELVDKAAMYALEAYVRAKKTTHIK